MNNNTFYGKKLEDLNQDELQLLSLDLQICSLGKKGERMIQQLALAHKFRVQSVNKCLNCGGDYSRETFLNETGLVDEGPTKEEIKLFTDYMNKATQAITGAIVDAFKEMEKEILEEKNNMNGKIEEGFQMN